MCSCLYMMLYKKKNIENFYAKTKILATKYAYVIKLSHAHALATKYTNVVKVRGFSVSKMRKP